MEKSQNMKSVIFLFGSSEHRLPLSGIGCEKTAEIFGESSIFGRAANEDNITPAVRAADGQKRQARLAGRSPGVYGPQADP